jgi:uncharacterized protein (DUF1501 family)
MGTFSTAGNRNKTNRSVSRRSLLSTGWRALAAANLIGMMPKLTAAAAGGRSVVCLYLLGGTDGNSILAPLDGAQYDAWAASRGELALQQSDLLPVQTRSAGTRYGFHPALAELQQLFNLGSLAVVANVGSQTRITPKSTPSKAIPPEVRYSSLTFVTDGYATLQWAAAKAGITGVDRDRVFTFPGGVTMLPLGGSSFAGESRRRNPDLIRFEESAAGFMPFPDTPAGRQLRTVAGLIQRGGAGAGGEVFFVPVAGMNIATRELTRIDPAFRQLSQALAAFYQATLGLGLDRQVVTFTDSEYGRSMAPNSQHGSNAGWGNHQIVLGGGVKGGEVYGVFPQISAPALDSDGSLIPTTACESYHGTFASWMGLSDSEVLSLFPNLPRTSAWRMGFMA